MLTDEQLYAAYYSRIENDDQDPILGLRAVAEAAVKDAVGGEGVRYTNDGALAECPCCGSLDVGGAHDTVHCYKCGLSMRHPPPLQNAADAWNRRTRPQASAAVPDGYRLEPDGGCCLTSYAEDGSTCTLNLNGQEIYFDRNDHVTALAASQPEVKS